MLLMTHLNSRAGLKTRLSNYHSGTKSFSGPHVHVLKNVPQRGEQNQQQK